MQRVDPFIPVSPSHKRPAQSANKTPQLVKYGPKRPAGTVEGFVRPQPLQTQPVRHSTAPTEAPEDVPEPPAAPNAPVKPRRRFRLLGKLKTTVLMVLILLAGTMVQSLAVGEILIGLYAVYALVRRVASRTTFVLVLISLGAVVAARLVGNAQIAANFAVYSLLLVFVGVILLAREVRKPRT